MFYKQILSKNSESAFLLDVKHVKNNFRHSSGGVDSGQDFWLVGFTMGLGIHPVIYRNIVDSCRFRISLFSRQAATS